MSGCCERCGVHLLGRPHRVALILDLGTAWKLVVCVRCRDEVAPRLLELAQGLGREHSVRVAPRLQAVEESV